jgi:hypothetical protein
MTDEFRYDFFTARNLIDSSRTFTFYPCLIAAMAQADDKNLAILKDAFPAVYESWQKNRNLSLQCKYEDWKDSKKMASAEDE